MNSGTAFRAIGFGVAPARRRELRAKIPPHAPPWTYSISTSVTTDHGGGTIPLTAQFDVRDER